MSEDSLYLPKKKKKKVFYDRYITATWPTQISSITSNLLKIPSLYLSDKIQKSIIKQ